MQKLWKVQWLNLLLVNKQNQIIIRSLNLYQSNWKDCFAGKLEMKYKHPTAHVDMILKQQTSKNQVQRPMSYKKITVWCSIFSCIFQSWLKIRWTWGCSGDWSVTITALVDHEEINDKKVTVYPTDEETKTHQELKQWYKWVPWE